MKSTSRARVSRHGKDPHPLRPSGDLSTEVSPARHHAYQKLVTYPGVSQEVSLYANAAGLALQISPVWQKFPSPPADCGFWNAEEKAAASPRAEHPACRICSDFHTKLFQRVLERRESVGCRCFLGLASQAWPVLCHGEVIAYLWVAGIRLSDTKPLRSTPASFALGNVEEKIGTLPLFSSERWDSIARLMLRVAAYLGGVAEQLREPDRILEPEERAMRWLEENFSRAVSLRDLPAIARTSPQNLHRRWRSRFGETPGHSLSRIRIHKARETMASNPEKKIIEIAMDCGFGSLSQFNRTFRKMSGMSPAQARTLQG